MLHDGANPNNDLEDAHHGAEFCRALLYMALDYIADGSIVYVVGYSKSSSNLEYALLQTPLEALRNSIFVQECHSIPNTMTSYPF